jgi:primase-polymerase (primpol)-like protein
MSVKPPTYVADLTHLPKALERITGQKRWVVWRWEKRVKKNGVETWTKPPYQCSYPLIAAKSNDPNTWGTYQAAIAAVEAGLADGIGFMLKDSDVAAADLDHVRDAQTGEPLGWAKRLCLEADSLGLYREITVSGSGLRFIGLSQGDELHRKFTFNRSSGAGIELYRNCGRYITISGLQEGSCEGMGQIGDYLDQLVARFNRQQYPHRASSISTRRGRRLITTVTSLRTVRRRASVRRSFRR